MLVNNGRQNTGILFIGISVLIMFFHSVIPHHHHFDSLFTHFEKVHSPEKGCNGNGEDSPGHCHAFNELAVDKIVSSNGFAPELTAILDNEQEIIIPRNIDISGFQTEISVKAVTVFLFKPLRAPPGLS